MAKVKKAAARYVKPVFETITLDQFERLADSVADYDETEINGHPIMTASTPEGKILGVYYSGKGFGTKMVSGDLTADVIIYCEADSYWPWED